MADNNGYNGPYTGEYIDRKLAPIKHKSVTLQPSNWELFEGVYRARIPVSGTDSDLIVDCTVIAGSDESTTGVWDKAGGINGVMDVNTIGFFYAKAKKKPIANINYKYSIGL